MLKDEKIFSEVNEKIKEIFWKPIKNWEFLGQWYISIVYKVELENWQKIVLKFINNQQVWGFEYPLEVVKSIAISDLMMQNAEKINKVKSRWVYNVGNIYVHMMDFVAGRKMKLEDLLDKSLIFAIASKIAHIHLYWKSITGSFEKANKKFFYKRWFREVFANNETLLSIYENRYIESDYKNLWWKVFNLILKKYNEYISKGDSDRLTILHGDFWYDNIIISQSDIYFIDFSRIPYGDPGIDVGRFIGEIFVQYIISEDKKWLNSIRLFLEKYLDITKDKQIINYIDMSVLWVIFIDSSPLVQQFLKWDNKKIGKIEKFIGSFSSFEEIIW